MHPSTAVATVLVDELVRGGVREAVLAPGSRSAPLAYALHEADASGRLRLHVRVDERSAAFLALGLAKASGIPVPVVCTSGTAAANLHPAVLEAHHGGVPLVLVTADRPAELRGTGANQTTDQVNLYGVAVRDRLLLAAAVGIPGEVATWRSSVCRALVASAGELDGDPGPVHVNVELRPPLVPDGEQSWLDSLDGRADGGPWTRVSVAAPSWSGPLDGTSALGSSFPRTLVLVGDVAPAIAAKAAQLASRRGWPLGAEPSAGLGEQAIPHFPLLLGAEAWLEVHAPQRVLVVGRLTLSRTVQALLADPRVVVDVVTASPHWSDPPRRATAVFHASWLDAALREPAQAPAGHWASPPAPRAAEVDAAWAHQWAVAGSVASQAIGKVLGDEWPSGPAVARAVVAGLPPHSLLVLGSSSPVRDVDAAATWPQGSRVRVLANRGLGGIDGTVSTAVGAALAAQAEAPGHAYALMGDLTLLHDANGLLLGHSEPTPNLCLVVVNDDGGSIFGRLEQGGPAASPAAALAFERVFGTPTGADLAALCAATGTPHQRVGTPDELAAALQPAAGVRVVEVQVPRSAARALWERLQGAVTAALNA